MSAVLDIANKLYKDAGVTPPWVKNGGAGSNEVPYVQTTAEAQSSGNADSKSDVYSSKTNPSKKAGFPVYTPYDGGYTVDYDVPYAELPGDTTGKSNDSTQGNNASTIGNVNDEDNKIVGSFLNKNIFGGLSESANPGESLS